MSGSIEHEAAKLKNQYENGEISKFVYQLALKGLKNLEKNTADLTGSGSVAQNGSVSSGAGGLSIGGNVYGGIYTGPPPENHEEKLRIYRRVVADSVAGISLRGLDVGASDAKGGGQLGLAEVYVDLDTKTPRRQKSRSEEKGVLSVLEAAVQHRCIVILGDPGSGKSTFLNHLCLCLAGHQGAPDTCFLNRIACWPEEERDILPIPVILRDFSGWLPDKPGKANAKHLSDFIEKRLDEQNMAFVWKPLQEALEKGGAMLLLDGLDEIPTHEKRIFIRNAVSAFAVRYPDCRFAVTCRVLSYQDKRWKLVYRDEQKKFVYFPSVELAPFDDKKIDQFISAWYNDLVRVGTVKDQKEGVRLAGKLQNAVRRPDMWRLASNPLLLTVMALVHAHKGELPEARSKLYEETVDILLWRWEKIKAGNDENPLHLLELLRQAQRKEVHLKRLLCQLAFEAHKKTGKAEGDATADIGELRLLKSFAAMHPDKSLEWAQQMVKTIKQRAGLLIERAPEIYTFPHRTFQEYLAGSFLASQGKFADICSKLAEEGDLWREAILLAAGKLFYVNEDIDKPLALIGELCPGAVENTKTAWRKAWLAGDVLLEIGPNSVTDSNRGRELNTRVRHRLVKLIQEGALAPKERVAAGNALARLGDPRFRPNFWHLPNEEGRGLEQIGFVKVPAGPFWMGSEPEKDERAQSAERPYHQVELPAFYISKYPVTVAQFRAFVDDSEYKPNDPRCLDGVDSHPVAYVTWHDAVAYCRWLTEKMGKKKWGFRLPSEAEWEKAARGDDGRIYPWGNEAEPDRANYGDTKIGGTSPVGCFPSGVSPYGCFDMAGNVWEWTRSLWGKDLGKLDFKYPYDPLEKKREDVKADNGIWRVLRGGAFYYNPDGLRCALRSRHDPDDRHDGIGFRCVCAPVTSEL